MRIMKEALEKIADLSANLRSGGPDPMGLQDQLAEDIRLLNEKIAAFDKLENPK